MKTAAKLSLIKQTVASTILAAAIALPVQAADEVNVAYFLEWATPNMISKAKEDYDDAMGVKVNWTAFDAGTQMTEAMLAGDIDISYSQGLAPFITAVNANAPIKLVAIAVQYPANDCVVRNGAGIDKTNASELEGKSVAVPLATMADYSFRMMMRALDVDVSKIQIVDQVPADAAASLTEGAVTMACGFGGIAMAKMYEAGKPIMTAAEMEAAGIISFDVVSVTEKFAQENPELLRTFLEVTDAANAAFSETDENLKYLMQESGLDKDGVRTQMAGFHFPSRQEQLEKYFNKGGLADVAIGVVGVAFGTADNPPLDDYGIVIDTSYLK